MLIPRIASFLITLVISDGRDLSRLLHAPAQEAVYDYNHPVITTSLNSAFYALQDFFGLTTELLLACIWYRTAVAITELLSSDRRPRLLRFMRTGAFLVIPVLIALTVTSYAVNVWALHLAQIHSTFETGDGRYHIATVTRARLSIAFAALSLTVTLGLLPLVLWQTMGRRVDVR